MSRARIASILWYPVVFAVLLPVTFGVVYHQPKAHRVPIAMVGTAALTAPVAAQLQRAGAGGFLFRQFGSPGAAVAAVRDRQVAAAYVPGPASTVFVARSAAPLRASYLQNVFTRIALTSGRQPPRWVDLVPLASGDSGTGLFFFEFPLMMIGVITAIVLLQLPTFGVGRRALVVAVVGAIGAVASYLTAVGLDVLPGKPLLLPYAFAITQVYGLLMVGAASLLKQYFLPFSLTVALLLSTPSSGGTVAADLMPTLFRDLSYALPLAQGVTITRAIAYFHSGGIAQATLVTAAWAALAVATVALAWRRQSPQTSGPSRDGRSNGVVRPARLPSAPTGEGAR
ncbi:MAG TPA: hypothetical protein VFI54_10460 [Solirubrobacteraceae bacterium]|nr:hypothetical protein [Solirubrobacteraceae bacterium]